MSTITKGERDLQRDGEYPHIKCPVCDSDNYINYAYLKFGGIEWEAGVACTNCNSKFTVKIKCHQYLGEWTEQKDIDLHK